MKTPFAITSFLFLTAMLLIPSAQAMSPPRLHQSDGIKTDVGYRGGGRVGVARGGVGVGRYGVGVRRGGVGVGRYGVGVGVRRYGVGVGRYYGGRYCPGTYHYWNGVACVDSRGYSYVSRPYVNRGYVNRGYVRRGRWR
jgi:hypothetical protein